MLPDVALGFIGGLVGSWVTIWIRGRRKRQDQQRWSTGGPVVSYEEWLEGQPDWIKENAPGV